MSLPFDFAQEHVDLAPLTLYKVGGRADIALFPRTQDEACEAYTWMSGQPGRKMVLGGGSNVLISDEGFHGIVLVTTGLTGVDQLEEQAYAVEGGVELDHLVREVMIPQNFDGVGGLTGIPGSVGGAIYMNAGTVNGTIGQLLHAVDLIGPAGRQAITISPSLYGYRGQTFCPAGSLILRGIFQFRAAEEDQQARYDHYIRRRQEKQPAGNCCGSVFKNPEGEHAGRLIEACGLKGARRGGALVSPMHANFIMNDDNATFGDIVGLMEECKRQVLERFGIALEEEVRIIQ